MQTNESFYLQACVGCEEVSETLTEEDSPDLHMGETESSDVTVPPANSSEASTHSETHGCPGPVTWTELLFPPVKIQTSSVRTKRTF